MKRELPPYVYQQRNGMYFQRRGWPSIKLANQEIGPGFWAEYALILKGNYAPKVATKTIRALITNYRKSQRFDKLKPRTQADYDKHLSILDKLLGDVDPRVIERKDVIRLRDSNAQKYRRANYLVQVLRIIMEHAINIGWRKENPAKMVSMLKSPYEARKPWPIELVTKYRNSYPHGTRDRLVFELCVGTGQRIGDILRMKWSDIAGDGINVKQGKTGKEMWIPLTPDLRESLSSTKRRNMTVLTNQDGSGAWSYRGASQAVRLAREAIGALDYDLHSLRYYTATELASCGCTDELIAAVTGQSPAMVKKYTETVRQKVRAIEAQGKRT